MKKGHSKKHKGLIKEKNMKNKIKENKIKHHNNNINNINYGIAESISKIIIEKIISNAVILSRNKQINNQLNNYCFQFLTKNINNILNLDHFDYEDVFNNEIQSNKNFNNKEIPSKINTWIEINEPETPISDRFVSLKMKTIIIKKKDDDILNKEINNYIPINEKDEYNENNINKKQNKKIKNILKLKLNDAGKEKDKIQDNKNTNKKDIPVMAYSDLDKEKYINTFVNEKENDLLRKELKEKESLKKEENKKKIIPEKNNIKIFDDKNLTFDSNGKIIKKILKKGNLLKNEFNLIKSKVNKAISMKNIFKDSNKYGFDNNKNKIKVEYNNNNNINLISENDLIDKERKQVIISGNSYNSIKPEIGVIVKNDEDLYKKEGGFDYLLKFNKFSVNDYSKMLIKSRLLNTQQYLTSNNLSGNNISSNNNIKQYESINDLTSNNDYNGYNQAFNDRSNPLINNAHLPSVNSNKNEIKKKSSKNIKMKILSCSKYDKNIQKSKSNKDIFSNTLSLNDMSFQKNIKILSKEQSLFSVLSDANNLQYNMNYISSPINKNLTNKDANILTHKRIFSYNNKIFPLINKSNKNIENKNTINKEDTMNLFNYKIIKNKNWGTENESKNSYFNESNMIKNYFRMPSILNKVKILNNNTKVKINNRLRNFNFSSEKSNITLNDYKIKNKK